MRSVTPVEGPWARTWAIALAVVIVFFGCVEIGFRAQGMTPQYQDTPRLWGYWRARVVDDPKAVALVGSSRTQLGVNPELMSELLDGRTVANLALNGSTPVPVLEQLAADESFTGTALVEGYPSALFLSDGGRRQGMQPFLGFYGARSSIEDLEVQLRSLVQGSLVIARPDFRPTLFAVTLLIHRRLPQEGYTKMHFTRWVAADYELDHPSNTDWKIVESTILEDEAVSAQARHVKQLVAKIEGRGGKVVFVRVPSSSHVREAEAEFLPRARYWDRFVRESGVKAVHFEDLPSMKDLQCGDGGHLDKRDVPAFTRALAELL